MKKLLCITLFSIVLMSSTTKIEKEEVKLKENIENIAFFGCGSEGNAYYSMLIMEGETHRDARESRRAYVRKCRGGGWNWVFGIWTFGTIGL
ncbi:hypothetical protein [Polaribacter sp. M15]